MFPGSISLPNASQVIEASIPLYKLFAFNLMSFIVLFIVENALI